jgi:hypothetical protein
MQVMGEDRARAIARQAWTLDELADVSDLIELCV